MLSGPLFRRAVGAAAVAGVVVATIALTNQPDVATVATVATRSPASSAPAASAGAEDPQVLVISLDGLNPDAMRRLGHAGVPHLWRLFDEGAGTLNARSQVELTLTLPNHTSMVTGRRIDRRRGGHGVTWNDDRLRPRTVQDAARRPVDSVFSRVEASGRSAALFSAKTKFGLFERSWPRGVDRLVIRDEDDAAVTAAARRDLVARDRAFTFLHLGHADYTGHHEGWMSPAYLDAVRGLDTQVGRILSDAVKRPALADLTIVLTADHGGVPGATKHDAVRRLANFRVPFVVWGPGVEHADLYAINPGYAKPGHAQPRLGGRQPIRNGNVANLALDLLGLDPVPGSLFGVKRPLRVAAP